jgi:hypothetical protein
MRFWLGQETAHDLTVAHSYRPTMRACAGMAHAATGRILRSGRLGLGRQISARALGQVPPRIRAALTTPRPGAQTAARSP